MGINSFRFNPNCRNIQDLLKGAKKTTPSDSKTEITKKDVENSNSVNSSEQIKNLENQIKAAQDTLKQKIKEYKFFCIQYRVQPSENLAEWENAATIGLDDIAYAKGDSYYDALSKRLEWVQKFISEVSDEISKLTTTTANNLEDKINNNSSSYSVMQIAKIKNDILNAQKELKSKINEYKHFCEQYGVEPNENLAEWENAATIGFDDIAYAKGDSYYDTLSKRLQFIQSITDKVTQEINNLTNSTTEHDRT